MVEICESKTVTELKETLKSATVVGKSNMLLLSIKVVDRESIRT